MLDFQPTGATESPRVTACTMMEIHCKLLNGNNTKSPHCGPIVLHNPDSRAENWLGCQGVKMHRS